MALGRNDTHGRILHATQARAPSDSKLDAGTEITKDEHVADILAQSEWDSGLRRRLEQLRARPREWVVNPPKAEAKYVVHSRELDVTDADFIEAKNSISDFSLQRTVNMMKKVYKLHENDPNFPPIMIDRIKVFLDEPVVANPEKHGDLIQEIKLFAALITNNSPYAEVRAAVSNRDSPSVPSSTIRSWTIGLLFAVLLAFTNQLFAPRMPAIYVGTNTAQLLALPLGRAAARWLPDWGFTLSGVRHSLNPGPFSKKEHMLITIMANVANKSPYTNAIIWTQYLEHFFGQPYAGKFAYQILVSLSTNFIGYGMAGICRKFLVYPAHCVWPASLVTIALNSAFHDEANEPAEGPLGTTWRISRLNLFYMLFGAMFVWFWIPDYAFVALSTFNWINWLAPENVHLAAVAGMHNGLGINPLPTFDWNILHFNGQDPLMVPFFATMNRFVGACITAFLVLGLWYTGAYNTGYLPINSNRVFDHFGKAYRVLRAVDDRGLFNEQSYTQYSPPFLSAGLIVVYGTCFAVYSATLVHTVIYHRQGIGLGLQDIAVTCRKWMGKGCALGSSLCSRRSADVDGGNNENEAEAEAEAAGESPEDSEPELDIHARLMRAYPEVPEWAYSLCLIISVVLGMAGIMSFPTYTTPFVIFYGMLLCLLFVIPVGIIKSMTGIEVSLNVLAEFIGGIIANGNALEMNYFKTYGYVTCASALEFCNDLKLAHYVKIPPRHTFWAQMVATFIGTFVSVGVLNYQMRDIPNVCTPEARFKLTCPGINSFFAASVLWGTVGPRKMFWFGGQYAETLIGFPLGVVLVLGLWGATNMWPTQRWLKQVHPIAMLTGGFVWAPFNLSYMWPHVPIGWVSWVYLKSRFLGLWSKYNFVISAAFGCGIAIAGLFIFFTLQMPEIEFDWWGNTISYEGCEGRVPCVLKHLADGEYFGPRIGEFG